MDKLSQTYQIFHDGCNIDPSSFFHSANWLDARVSVQIPQAPGYDEGSTIHFATRLINDWARAPILQQTDPAQSSLKPNPNDLRPSYRVSRKFVDSSFLKKLSSNICSPDISGTAGNSEAHFLYHLFQAVVKPNYCCQAPPTAHEVTWPVQPRPWVVWKHGCQ